jgi:hypothetical protein
MVRECRTHEGEEKSIQGFGLKAREVGGRIILKWISEKQAGMVWTGFNWLRLGVNGGLLST